MAVQSTDADSNLSKVAAGADTSRDRWRRVEELFNAAHDLHPADRPALLAAVCGHDDALRREVESLLESADRTLDLLQRHVQNVAQEVSGAPLSSKRIGNYELIKRIGEGGMGEVYLAARADDQFRQRVAIKLIRVGLEQHPSMLARFLAERQILANLNHPNIACLLDGGLTAEGWPYLVMELVEGTPVDEYCRARNLFTPQRLRLFRTVCGAVEYTHQNLIVHRDIKPSNILVNAKGVPKLLDFGIAQLLDPSAKHLEPCDGESMMTPDYASPEQIMGNTITTASDTFALGLLLYEMLTGCHAFRTYSDRPGDICEQICERDPRPPTEIARLNPQAAAPDARKWRSELDGIIATALQKDPAKRYQSVARFSADVAAYMGDRPLPSLEPAWSYVTAKFFRRNRLFVTLSAMALLAVITFSLAMAAFARRATVERLKAERETKFLIDLFKAATPEKARGDTLTARNLLDEGARRIDTELAAVPEVRASLMQSMAEAYESLGMFDDAKAMAERAYKLKLSMFGRDRATADSLFLFANLTRLQGHYTEAEPLFRDLVKLESQTAGENHPSFAHSLNALGECLYLEGKDSEAEPLLRRALAINRRNGPDLGSDGRNYLALLLERKGDYPEAVALLTEAVAIDRRTQGADSPDYATSLHNLASAMIDLGNLAEAEAKLRETLAIRRRVLGNGHPSLAYTLNNLGYVLLEKGDWRSAEPFLKEALALNTQRLGEKHPSVAGNLSNWARLLQARGDLAGARRYFEKALENLRQANALTSWPASQILLNWGLLEFDSKNYIDAETLARQAMEIRRRLGGDNTPGMASALLDLAEDQLFEGYPKSAVPLLRRALEIRRAKYTTNHPAVIAAEVRLGEALISESEPSTAEPLLREALQNARTAPFKLLPWQLAETESAMAACDIALGHVSEAQSLETQTRAALASHPRPVFREPAIQRLSSPPRRSRVEKQPA